jgi:hypothetical protein
MIGGLLRKGNIEEFEFWSSHNVDFMMLSVAYDFFLDEDKFSRVLNLKDKFGLNLLIHPRPDGQTFQTPEYSERFRHPIPIDSATLFRSIAPPHSEALRHPPVGVI